MGRHLFCFVTNWNWRKTALPLLLCTLLVPYLTLSQDRISAAQEQQLASIPRALPSDLLLQVKAIGERMRRPGKEETVLEAQLLGLGDAKSVLITHQLSGMVRIDGAKPNAPLLFDGVMTKGAETQVEQALLETIVTDSIEGLVYAFRAGGALRLIGRGFGPDPRIDSRYQGPRYDIYELLAPVRTRLDRQLRLKHFYFDSSTGLLLSTRYTDTTFSPEMKVETRFSSWQQIDGSAFPGRIDHYQNSNLIFSVVVSQASSRSIQTETTVH